VTIKAILDTNVLISGIFWKGAPFEILKAWQERRFRLAMTLPILYEYHRVLDEMNKKRPIPVLSTILEIIELQSEMVEPVSFAKTVCDDPDDDKLAPQLANRPLQIDLLSPIGDRITEEPLEEIATIPTGVYRQVRVRFADDALASNRLQGESGCAGVGSNCVVMADNAVRPLLFDTASPELRITTERIAASFLVILPDIGTDLVIELKPVWTLPGRGEMRLFLCSSVAQRLTEPR
jgi:putative PIN family toxin of toxin-antitoxin system